MKRSGRCESDRMAEDSLENTFSCVPKVQGVSRISQANGRRRRLLLFQAVLIYMGTVFCLVNKLE